MSNWEKVKVKDVCTIVNGGTPKTSVEEYWNSEDVVWITPTDITQLNSKYISDSSRKISTKGLSESSATLLPVGSVLMCSRATIGPCAINTIPVSTNQGFKSFICSERINNEYLYYLISILKDYFIDNASGSTFLEVSKSVVENCELMLPPLKEQQKIAEILSSVDAVIEKTEQVIAKTEEVKKGLMQQLLTKGIGHTEFKQTELGEIPVEWEIKNLVEVAVLTMGQSPSSEDCNEDGQGLVFFQGCSEFGDKYPIPKKYCTNPRKRASKGDILISVRAPVGDLNIAHIECAIGRGLAAIDPINIDRDYLFYYFKLYKDQWQRIQQGSTFSAINKNDLESVLVPCPPKDEQMLIVSKLLTLDKKLEIETEQLDSLQILKKGLMQQLLTGQVRVKVD